MKFSIVTVYEAADPDVRTCEAADVGETLKMLQQSGGHVTVSVLPEADDNAAQLASRVAILESSVSSFSSVVSLFDQRVGDVESSISSVKATVAGLAPKADSAVVGNIPQAVPVDGSANPVVTG